MILDLNNIALGFLIQKTLILIFNQMRTNKSLHSDKCLHFGGGVIDWRSINQSCIVDSTIEAEYIAACEVAKEVV